MKKKALIIGVNGQDGSFLAQHLHGKNYSVLGIGRQKKPRNEILYCLEEYYKIDIRNIKLLKKFLYDKKIDIIFHAAAVHGAAGFLYEEVWCDAHSVNTLSLHAVLEYARKQNKSTNIFFLSSGKVFGNMNRGIITENNKKYGNCIYTITKISSESLISYYRDKYKIKASIIWLFNHESEFRTKDYFIMKVIEALQNGLVNSEKKVKIKNLDFWCDWGSADEYMYLLATYSRELIGQDYILSSGKTYWAKDIVNKLFLKYGIEYDKFITTEESYAKNNQEKWIASNEKFKAAIRNKPEIDGNTIFEYINKKIEML
jgi:GDPmannose 4,6-dehydratase